jgi:protein-L-isoaspartate(D-aspartate) O-methyltransferase
MADLDDARRGYAELIRRTAGLKSERLVNAFAQVPREDYLGPGPWKILRLPNLWSYEQTPDDDPTRIYADVLVALDPGRHLNNGLPSGLAKWIEALDLRRGDVAVHAGCGTGYYTAIMADFVGREGHVTAIEFAPELAARARASLRDFEQVEVVTGDAATLDFGAADAIFVNAGATQPLPLWLDNLKARGRMVFPLVRWPHDAVFGQGAAGFGVMLRVQRMEWEYSFKSLSPVGVFPCVGALDSNADRLVAEVFDRGGLPEAGLLRRDAHDPDSSCVLHGRGYCFSTASAQ